MIAAQPSRIEQLGAGADALALRYQRGDTDALAPLYDALRPVIAPALRDAAARTRELGLPGPLEWADLRQQAWPILADLARRWDPAGGAFGAYVRVSFGWTLAHYIEQQSHARRSPTARVVSVPHDEADLLLRLRAGDDGRRWAESLALAELVLHLPPRQRAVVRLLDVEGRTIVEVTRRLGIDWATVHNERRRALQSLRRWHEGGHFEPPHPWAALPPLARLLRALLAGRTASGDLPGRGPSCKAAGISQIAYGRLMADLVARGVIEGRDPRHPGRLVEVAAVRLLQELDGDTS